VLVFLILWYISNQKKESGGKYAKKK